MILAVVCRGIIWQGYLWLRAIPSNYAHLPVLWIVCSLYFAFLLWLFLLLLNNGKRYPGMAMDALLGGCLLLVGSLLHDADLRPVLSGKGFGAAAWVTFFSASALIISNWANASATGKRAGDVSANKVGDEDLPAE